jgi:glycine/D-amino acid oxidase-like deaminating enzyme
MSSGAHIVPRPTELTIGSSYEHTFSSLEPDPAQTARILAKADRILPGIRGAPILCEKAGVRATVPVTRLPVVGPLPSMKRTWIFNGLGSKGLLLASLLARDLPAFLDDVPSIPREVRPGVR